MTTDQRLERIESLLECLLEVAKIQARANSTPASHNGMVALLRAVVPIEHPKPAPEPHPDSDPHRLTGYRGNWPDMHPYSSAKPPVDYRDDSTAGRQDP